MNSEGNQFKDLNLDRAQLQICLNEFCQDRQYKLELIDDNPSKIIFKLIRAGVEPGRIVFHSRTNGTTTIQVSEGKNKELNTEVAKYVKSKLCQNEISSLNMAILGIDDDIIKIILEEVSRY